jgi:hypothetical protein
LSSARQYERPAGPYHAAARQAGGAMAAGDKGALTGKLVCVQEHDDLTVSHALVREIEGIDFDRLQATTVAKRSTALTQSAGAEKTMPFASKTVFERFIRDQA